MNVRTSALELHGHVSQCSAQLKGSNSAIRIELFFMDWLHTCPSSEVLFCCGRLFFEASVIIKLSKRSIQDNQLRWIFVSMSVVVRIVPELVIRIFSLANLVVSSDF